MRLPQVGSVFEGKYRLEEILGSGGFATVFRATESFVNRSVAIKILRPDDRGYRSVEKTRFLREVRALAKLSSPHAVQVFDYGETADGLVFMVSELLPGQDLAQIVSRGPVEEQVVTHVLRQLLQALGEAHRVGLLHRDIKPENVRMYTYADDPWRAKLLDFGIAKDLSSEAPNLTDTGVLIGTPRYMSPEQLRNQDLTPASDLYSVGLLAYEMLLGRSGMHGGSLLDQVARLADPNFPRLDLIESPALKTVVGILLEVEPDRRFSSAGEALERLGSSAMPLAGPADGDATGVEATTKKWIAGESWAGVGLALVLLVGLGVGGAYLASSQPEAARLAKVPKQLTVSAPAPPVAEASPQTDLGTGLADTRPDSIDAGPDTLDTGVLSGCGQEPPNLTANVQVGNLTDSQGRQVSYQVPRPYEPHTRYPVVMMFHGRRQAPNRHLREAGLTNKKEDLDFFIIAPRDAEPPLSDRAEHWRYRNNAGIAQRALKVIDERFCLDRDRIYAIGYDDGGKAVEDLRCYMPEIRAIATSGYRSPIEPRCESDAEVPYIHLVGQDDQVVPLKGGGCRTPKSILLEEHEAIWRARNDCSGGRVEYQRGKKQCWRWNCAASFVSCQFEGGHGWPNSSRPSLDYEECYPDTNPRFDQIATIFRFFNDEHTQRTR